MKRRLWIWISAAAILAAVAAIVVIALAMNSAPTAPPVTPPTAAAPDPSPVPEPASTASPDELGDDVEALIAPFIAAEAASRSDPSTPLAFEDVAAGDALEDLKLDAFEFSENGMVQSGAPTVVSAEVEDYDADASPPTAVVRLCLDFSKVDIQAPDGQSVKSSDAPQRVPSLLTLQSIEGRWLVTARSYPDESSC
ncbi:hypothetical protein ACFPZL_04995 [Leucobacter soli]|uniref:Uncharacterized protein n=1 Tax=Leucobacter soli TaxID=2812850 RepID=A0A916JVN8_9MICO|nr:hypothetical protein [Leucobacter soli]CAG7606959.1 hypothetical protein LEUCIP111803_00975 [Leucobacter soli]